MAQTVLQPNLPAAATPSSSTIPKFEQLPESKYECENIPCSPVRSLMVNCLWSFAVDWADLVTLDLSQFDTSGGKQRLAEQLKDAVHRVGKRIYRSSIKIRLTRTMMKAFSTLSISALLRTKLITNLQSVERYSSFPRRKN